MTPQEREDREVLREIAQGYKSFKWVLNFLYRAMCMLTAFVAGGTAALILVRWIVSAAGGNE